MRKSCGCNPHLINTKMNKHKYPQFIMGVLAQAKNGDEQVFFGNRNFMQPIARLSMHSKCLEFFSFKFWGPGGGGGGRGDFFSFFLCSLKVPYGFPSGSHYAPYVPNVFPKGVPNSTSL